MARFYLSEISTAIHFIHEMGYIHRDVKPENVLVDVSGHIKLTDFGSAAGLTEDGRISGQIPFPVGTPEYVAPEVRKCKLVTVGFPNSNIFVTNKNSLDNRNVV